MNKKQPRPQVIGPLMWLKRAVYELGLRPNPGSILYSPSLAIHHFVQDYERKQGTLSSSMESALRRGTSMEARSLEIILGSGPKESDPLARSAQVYLNEEFRTTLTPRTETGTDRLVISHRGKNKKVGRK